MSLKDELMEIDGVGPKTADKILAVIEDSTVDKETFEAGYSYFKQGDYGYADKFFKQL